MSLRWFSFFLFIASSLFSQGESERAASVRSMFDRDLVLYHVPPQEVSWLWTQNIPISRLKKVKQHEIEKALYHIKNFSKSVQKPTRDASNPDNLWKNSHFGNLPFDETRTLRHVKGFFISANDVITPGQVYIVSEAPKQSTLLDFWKTIFETDTRTVLALAMPDPKPIRYPAYWEEKYLPKSVEGWTVRKVSEKVLYKSTIDPSQRIVKRTFQAVKNEEARTITHLHCENWPDHGAAASDLFYELLRFVEANHTSASKPIWVHCVAGIGRSGTFVAAHSLRKDLANLGGQLDTSLINIPQRVIELRLQRSRTLSTNVQLTAVYNAVKQYIDQRQAPRKTSHGKKHHHKHKHKHGHKHTSHHR
jgi:protein-tyrosine phosphatase